MLVSFCLLLSQGPLAWPTWPATDPFTRVGTVGDSRAQALSPDGNELAWTLDDGSVGIVSLESGTVLLRVEGFSEWMDSIAWSPDAKSLAVVAHEGGVRIICAVDGHLESQFSTSAQIVEPDYWDRSIDFVDGGSKLLLCRGGSPVQLRRRDGGLVAELQLDPKAPTTARAIDRDRTRFAIGDRAGGFGVWSARTGRLVAGPFEGPKDVNVLAFDPQGERLAVGAADCNVRIIPLTSTASVVTLSHSNEDIFGTLEIAGIEFSPDGTKLLASSIATHCMRLWNLETKTVQWSSHHENGNPRLMDVHFTLDGAFVCAAREGEVHDVRDGRLIRYLGDTRLSWHYFFAMDGNCAWITESGALGVYDIRDGRRLAVVPLPRSK